MKTLPRIGGTLGGRLPGMVPARVVASDSVGDIIFSESAPNATFLLCDGMEYAQADYPALFEKIGLLDLYVKEGDSTFASDPSSLPTGASNDAALSGDGKVYALASSVSPYMTVYDIAEDGTFTKRSDPSTLPPAACNGVAVNNDGSCVVMAHGTSPYVTAYTWDGSAWTKLADPSTLPASSGQCAAFNKAGDQVMVGGNGAPTIICYDFDGTTLTPQTAMTGGGARTDRIAFDPLGEYAVTAAFSGNYCEFYKRVGDAWVAQSVPTTRPTSASDGVAFSPDGQFVAIIDANICYMYRVDRENDALIYEHTINTSSSSNSVEFTNDSRGVITCSTISSYADYFSLFYQDAQEQTDGEPNPNQAARAVDWSPDGSRVIFALSATPFIKIVDIVKRYDDTVDFIVPQIMATDLNIKAWIKAS